MSGSNSSAPPSVAAPERSTPLHFTVHSMPTPQPLEEQRRTVAGRLKMLAVLAVCAAPVVASYFTYFVVRPEGRSNYSELVVPGRPLPQELPLAQLDGTPVAASSLQGQWLLVVVGDAQCDRRCEQHLLLQRQLRETLGREKDRLDKVWLIPDGGALRPEVQRAVSAGVPVQVLRTPRDVLSRWLEPAPGRALDEHLYIVDPMGVWMMRVPPEPEPSKLKRDVERLLRASSSWDRAGR